MAYVHCHNCGWEQDDFWDSKYNPVKSLIRCLKENCKPRVVHFDAWALESMKVKYTPVLVNGLHGQGEVHTWKLIKYHVGSVFFHRFQQQHWWTWESYEKDPNKQCPKCKHKPLDID